MSEKIRMMIIVLFLPFLLCLSSGEGRETARSWDFAGKVVNFLILFGGLAYVLYKPVRAFLAKKASDIDRSLDDAASFQKESKAKHDASKARLASLSEEIGKLKAEAERQGKEEQNRIVKLMKEEGRKIKMLTSQEIETYAQAEIRDLKAVIAGEATSLAREKIRKKLVPEDQARRIDQSIERLSRLNDESNAG